MRQERVLVISPRKSGTHLILRLLVGLGYTIWGDVGAPAATLPQPSVRERLDLARLVLSGDPLTAQDARERPTEFVEKTNFAWRMFAQSWTYRLGAAPMRPYQIIQDLARLPMTVRPQMWTAPFTATPPGICWIYHSLDTSAIDEQFLRDWHDNGNNNPAIIVNRRDPRDAVLSAAHFLASDTFRSIKQYPEAQLYSAGFNHVTELSDRIDWVLSDGHLPLLQDYERAVSFYRHPAVCNVSFEELVGPKGGGPAEGQRAAVARVADFLGIPCDAAETAEKLFDTGSFTFRQGQLGEWREALSDAHLALLDARHPRLLAALDYA